MQVAIVVLILIIWGLIKVFGSISEYNEKKAEEKRKKDSLDLERKNKNYHLREIDKNKTLYERNTDIVSRYLSQIQSSSSSYYGIQNKTMECLKEIAIAEGQDISNYGGRGRYSGYLSNWRSGANAEWKELSYLIEKKFSDRQSLLKQKEDLERENQYTEKANLLKRKYSDLIKQFYEVSYRKISTIDDYGDEDWTLLEKEINVVIEKIKAKEEGRDYTNGIKNKYKFLFYGDEYSQLKIFLEESFKDYYNSRKQKPTDFNKVNNMSGVEFETYLAEKLKAKGFTGVVGTKATGDQGADLIARKDGRSIVIQAKRYEGSVGNKAVQEVIGAIQYYNGDEGWVVTNSTFTKSAKDLAHKNNVKLIDGFELRNW